MPEVTAARNAVALTFALNGFCFASMVSRIPDLRSGLALDNGALGLLLLAIATGSVLALPSAGRLIERFGAVNVVRLGGLATAVGLLGLSLGVSVLGSVAAAAVGFFGYGLGTGVWDVAMNVEGAEVERRMARTVMPRFHAAWSLGSIAGAALGIPMAALGVPLPLHVGLAGVVALGLLVRLGRAFLPPVPVEEHAVRSRSAWREPRTLAIGVMVLAFATVEGSANDWLSLAIIDGYDAAHWVGVVGYSVFVTAMTVGRLLGPVLLDRWGRAPVLWTTAVAAAAGIVLVVAGGNWALVGLGIVVWGLGASLGFPVGMSAAADDPARSAARVSVVSTIGYAAFLAGPPLLGQLGDRVGTLDSLLAVALLMAPAALTVAAVRPSRAATRTVVEA
ncbi:MFS transporter [Nocardioides panaciterrulae]|uniref:MFS family permease n=1 Tax=Nocardioides panaciterrulae TaxID=661492 RepID=A0A7Y9E4T2_9ACTN|nr:MFS family permease [Nocardioides panaciterrulae]